MIRLIKNLLKLSNKSICIRNSVNNFTLGVTMEGKSSKIKTDGLDENPPKKIKLESVTDNVVDKRTVATMCGAWRPEEEYGGLILVFKTRTACLSPDPTQESDYPENIEDFWEATFQNDDNDIKVLHWIGLQKSLKSGKTRVVFRLLLQMDIPLRYRSGLRNQIMYLQRYPAAIVVAFLCFAFIVLKELS